MSGVVKRKCAVVSRLGDAQSSERVFASLVSGNYFDVVGTCAAAGRFFRPEEDRTPGAHPVVVLNHRFWSERFRRNPDLVGQTLRLNNLSYTVIGVAEPGFDGTTFLGTDLWVPMAMDAHVRASDRTMRDQRDASWMIAIGRLKPGTTHQQAGGELNAIAVNFMKEHGDPRIDRWGVSPDYFEALQITLTAGRAFNERDREGAPYVVIVNQKMAEQLWRCAPR